MTQTYPVRAIGIAQTRYHHFNDRCNYQEDVNVIAIDEELEDGLLGTEYFSHLLCVYYQHRQDEWRRHVGQREDQANLKLTITREPTCRGIFSKRSPGRPARLGSCIVNVVKREGRLLHVRGLDALDGSPILDIKPYIPEFDAFPLAAAPLHWCMAQTPLLRSTRLIHWDTVNVTLTLGLRAGIEAMRLLDVSRRDASLARVRGSAFFAQGVEASTGCSLLRGTLELDETEASGVLWTLSLTAGARRAEVEVYDALYADAGEVLSLPCDALFQRCGVIGVV